MSLMGTLAKVAIGVAVAKGIGGLMKSGGGVTTSRSSGGGSIFGGAHSPRTSGDLGDVMGDILSGGQSGGMSGGTVTRSSPGSSSGGLGGLLEELTRGSGGASQAGTGGGLNDVLGGLTKSLGGGGSAGGMGGGLGDLLGGLLGAGLGSAAGSGMGGGFGDVLNSALGNKGEPEMAPSQPQEAAAALMLRAMIQAAKSDGKIDAAEKDKLMKNLTDATPDEMSFVKQELAAPIDVDGLVAQVPQGLQPQVYAMSLLAIDLDNQNEAQYLHALATGMGLDRQTVNAIHAKVGVQPLYS